MWYNNYVAANFYFIIIFFNTRKKTVFKKICFVTAPWFIAFLNYVMRNFCDNNLDV